MLTLSVAYDHRVADGTAAARFTRGLKQALESLGAPAPAATPEPPRQVQARSGGAGYLTDLRSRRHTWSLDEPPEDGGEDIGPTPVEAFLGALLSCLTITLNLVARRREVVIERIEGHADANPTGHLSRITVGLDVWTAAPEERMRDLLLRAERGCYVRGLLKPEIEYHVDLRVHSPEG
jgi:pyruvate dehydrogenase E2 component (dihydrolipoamide acetyltransferase)